MELDLKLIFEHLPYLFGGAATTIIITIFALLLGLLIGLFVGMGRISRNFFIRTLASIYVTIIRGTPLLVQIFILYFGVPTALKISLNPYVAGILALGVNSGAYVAEIVRAGIQSIDKGQMEASRSLGLTHSMAMRYVILPQAFRRILPPIGNEFIMLLKDSSLVSTIALPELMFKGMLVASRTYDYFSMYIGVALVYLVLTWAAAQIMGFIERRFAIP